HLQTRQQVRTHLPEFAKLLDDSFRQNKWVYVPVAKRLGEPHLSGFDPADAPEFRWPPAVVEAFHRIEVENAEKEKKRKTESQR
ncbi:hypothetical protein N9Z85_01175, partial [Akkermansiaceae bacterium]|nr:hypothetical protein [Akkermansiaceae bacterium]